MFTGIVEATGEITRIETIPGDAIELSVRVPASFVAEGRIGDSVAINGCCLTVVRMDGPQWLFQAGHETLDKTNLGDLEVGDAVNLERALPANGRLGGHFVQGHVDGVGRVAAIEPHADWSDYRFAADRSLLEYLVPKGSVAVDGVSLTVVDVTAEDFSVALIPHTLQVTTLGRRRVGDRVNIETDILGKYVRRFLERVPLAGLTAPPGENPN
ncbi:MAG: riboflavin synthase [Planctomycetota bacterium]|nr:MAG: riboflavin synthase [Planctomycetota bacterium]